RAPPQAAELAKRRAAGLTPRQEDLLRRWGYPYVMEEFRFHITLTGPVEPDEAAALLPALRRLAGAVSAVPLAVEVLTLFRQAGSAASFAALKSFPLADT
ncbi:MAG TPA: DUF1045 domain-containing protein, partial [Alphaproteobacteria bacterium]|nr:DUF1045 domain-containing protein [Alphaproteobacteria bacterium]